MARRKAQNAGNGDYETRTSDDKVRCRLCLEHNTVEYNASRNFGWMGLDNFKRAHQKSGIHTRSIDQKAKKEREATRTIDNPPASHVELNGFSMAQPPIPEPYNTANQRMDEIWDEFDGTFAMEPTPEEKQLDARTLFDQKVEQHAEWLGVEQAPESIEMGQIADSWDDEENEDILTDLLDNIDLNRTYEEFMPSLNPKDATEWAPYPSKVTFLLDVLDNLPHNRISGGMMKVILWLLGELDVKGVPSFNALRNLQEKLRAGPGVPTVCSKTPKGHVFSFNDPRAIVAHDWSNPLVRPHIRRYPVIPENGVVSEIWHASKWHKDLDRRCLSPMYDGGGGRHYFLDEPAKLVDSRIVIPLRWLEEEAGAVLCDVWEVKIDSVTNLASIDDSKAVRIRASDLEMNMLDLQDHHLMPEWSPDTISKGYVARMPNPDRELAGGDPIYTSFVDIFGDDVSGNRSKSWNKHWNIYLTHRNLPRKLLQQQFHTHFVSTSTHASIPDQFHAVKEAIEETHRVPVRTRDALTGHQIRFKLCCNCGPGDNPAQSEMSGHIGGKGNYPCRKCQVGGSQRDKESDTGFHQLFSPGKSRSSAENLRSVESQMLAACSGVAQTVGNMQTDTGIKDAFSLSIIDDLIERARSLRKDGSGKSSSEIWAELCAWIESHRESVFNPYLTLKGFDVAADTPVEILHTILLGVVKYVWHVSHTSWDAKQKKTFSERLQSTDTKGLSIPPIRSSYILQYANSLIGRQFKILAQVNSFHVHDLVDDLRFQLIKATGELSALLWHVEIHDMEDYLNDVEVAAANVLDIAAELDPSKIVAKMKYHLLVHLREDITRFGPIVGVATEGYESFNTVFRHCSILSNHAAPSRDIALQLSKQEASKHILSGGWWLSSDTQNSASTWVQAGAGVRSYIHKRPALKELCGWYSNPDPLSIGSVKLESQKRDKDGHLLPRVCLSWDMTKGLNSIHAPPASTNPDISWLRAKHVVARSFDQCGLHSWVFATSPISADQPPICGQIVEIIQNSEDDTEIYVVLNKFDLSDERHPDFGMPVLTRCDDAVSLVLRSDTILFEFNAQHDCKTAGCVASKTRPVMQERVATTQDQFLIEHLPLARYLVNTHAFHNAHLIRRIIPRHLTKPIPYTDNRERHHHQLASLLRASQAVKRDKAAKRREENQSSAGEHDGRGKKRARTTDSAPEIDLALDV